MLFDTPQVFSKAKIVTELPFLAADGELAFITDTKTLYVFNNGVWIDINHPTPAPIEFCIYLPSIPDHTATIFKCIMPCDVKIDWSEMLINSINDLRIEVFVDNEFVCTLPSSDKILIQKQKCLSLKLIHKERHFPEDLAITIIGSRV